MDLAIVARWRQLNEEKCPGCGRSVQQHLHNPILGRAETPDDYRVWSLDCPAVQAISSGQESWRKQNKSAINAYMKGHTGDPSLGIYWLAQGVHESMIE